MAKLTVKKASVGGGYSQSRQNGQDTRNWQYLQPAMQAQQDQRNAPYFAAYAAAHPGQVTPGAPGVPAAAGPAGGGTPSPPPLPFDRQYADQITNAHRVRADTETSLGTDRRNTLLDYGFTEDPNGALGLDLSNPAGRAQALQRQWEQAKRGTLTTNAARGHLYSGSLVEQQNANVLNEGVGQARLLAALQGSLAQNSAARTAAGTTEEGTLAALLQQYAAGLTSKTGA